MIGLGKKISIQTFCFSLGLSAPPESLINGNSEGMLKNIQRNLLTTDDNFNIIEIRLSHYAQ